MKIKAQQHRFTSVVRSQLLISCIALLVLISLASLPAVPPSTDVNVRAAAASAIAQPTSNDVACPTCTAQAEAAPPHLLAMTYYSLRAGMRGTLMLNNKGPQPLDVQPTLFSLSGARMSVSAVTVPGNSFREIDLRDWAGSDDSFREGSLQVSYSGADLLLGAQVYLVDAARSLVFEEKFAEPSVQFASGRLESVWWLPSHHCRVRLVVSNTTADVVALTARVDGTAPRQQEPAQFTLLAHETRVLDPLTDLAGAHNGTLAQVGGVSLAHTGAGGAVLARLLIDDADRGYSSWARFTDPAKGKSNTYQGAGLRLGSAAGERLTPVVVARNVGESETTLTGRIPYTLHDGQTGTVTLPALQLAPGEVGTVDLTSALASNHVERDAVAAGLEFEHTGAPGSVLFGAQSVSQSLNQVFQVPLWDIEAQRSATGGYPWKIEGDTSTIVYIKNVTDRAQLYFLQLNYADADGIAAGTYATGLKSVAAGQTVSLDLRKMRDEQVPDAKEHTIPLDATRGQLHWSMRGADNLVLIGRAEQVDTVHGLASSYACQNCCPDSFISALAADCGIPMFPQQIDSLVATERDQDCYGTTYEYSVNDWVWIDWLSYAPDVATVDSNGLATGQAAGSAGIRAGWYASTWYFDFVHGYCKSSIAHALANSLCNVTDLDLDISPGQIRPSGTGDTNTATVTVTMTNPSGHSVANQAVNLTLAPDPQDTGGHVQHAAGVVRPLGTLARTQGVTDANGVFSTTYTAPIFGGRVIIRASSRDITLDASILVSVGGLSSLGGGTNYTLVGATATHPDNHYGTATALNNLPLIADDYKAQFYSNIAIPDGEKLRMNDMSLVYGGKFDIDGNWAQDDVRHGEHRVGINCDLYSANVPGARWVALTDIFRAHGSPRYNDETSTANHWHLRFE